MRQNTTDHKTVLNHIVHNGNKVQI